VGGAVVGAETVIYAGGESPGVARGLHIHFGIADQHSFSRGGAEFAKNRLRAERIGLLRFKAVAAVDGAKIFREPKRFKNAHADAHWLVGKNGHRKRSEMRQGFRDAVISAGRIHFVVLVIREEQFQRSLALCFRGVVAQGLADELRRPVADVAGDGVFVQLLPAHFLQHGVDGADQVELGIDERAIQIENQRAHGGKIRSSHEPTIVIWPHNFNSHPSRDKFQPKINVARFSEFGRVRVK